MKEKLHITNEAIEEKAVLVGVITKSKDATQLKEYLDELSFLAETAGAVEVKRFTQKLEYPDPRTFVGKGKLEEILNYIKENQVDVVIFDDELSPSQARNIERVIEVKVLDRSSLILDIFANLLHSQNAGRSARVPSGSILLNALLVDDIVGIDASLSASLPHVNPFRAQSDGPSVDIVTATRYRVSPYLDHKFSPTSTFYARADNVYTHTSGADPGTIPLHGSLVQNDVVRLDMKPDPVGLTVEGQREDTRFQGENQSALTIDAVRVVGWYGLDPQQAIGLVAGAERTEFLLTDAKDPIYGVRNYSFQFIW